MKVIISGGGTGGHIYPALAIAKGILEIDPEAQILYVGTPRGLEARIVPQEGLAFRTITVEGLPRRFGLALIRSLTKMTKGIFEALKIVKDFKPDIVIGTGGYVCGPIVFAAVTQKIPTLIHEQNAFPGITNKALALVVDKVAVTFPESVKYFKQRQKVTVTGLPVRPEIFSASPSEAAELGFVPGKFNLLVVGGSQGAKSLNQAMDLVIQRFGGQDNINILIVSGERGYEELTRNLSEKGISLENLNNVRAVPYLHKMPAALAAATMIICRAGATTLAEITAKGIPGILIPYPYAAENHQEYNAQALVNAGAAVMVKDSELTGSKLVELLGSLMDDTDSLREMGQKASKLGRPDALQNIIEMVQKLIG